MACSKKTTLYKPVYNSTGLETDNKISVMILNVNQSDCFKGIFNRATLPPGGRTRNYTVHSYIYHQRVIYTEVLPFYLNTCHGLFILTIALVES